MILQPLRLGSAVSSFPYSKPPLNPINRLLPVQWRFLSYNYPEINNYLKNEDTGHETGTY